MLLRRADLFLAALDRLGARVQPSLRVPGGKVSVRAIDEALALFSSAGWIEVVDESADGEARGKRRSKVEANSPDAVYALADDKRLSIEISKNVILHFFVPWALLCTAASMGADGLTQKVLRERVQRLSRLFKHEFLFRANAPFDAIFEETLDELLAAGVLVRRGNGDGAAIDIADDPDAAEQARAYAASIASFIEGYRVAARTLVPLAKGSAATHKDLVKKALATGKRMVLAGEVARREAVSRAVLENAFTAFVDQGYLERRDGKLALSPSFATLAAVEAIERRIFRYLPAAVTASSDRDDAGPPSSTRNGEEPS